MTDAHTSAPDLRTEARALHQALFRSEPPAQIVDRYVAAHAAGLGACTPAEADWLKRLLQSGADLSALELVLRRRNRKHVLVRKLHILTYITEGSAGYSREFLNQKPQRARAFIELFSALLRTSWKIVYGQYLLRRFP